MCQKSQICGSIRHPPCPCVLVATRGYCNRMNERPWRGRTMPTQVLKHQNLHKNFLLGHLRASQLTQIQLFGTAWRPKLKARRCGKTRVTEQPGSLQITKCRQPLQQLVLTHTGVVQLERTICQRSSVLPCSSQRGLRRGCRGWEPVHSRVGFGYLERSISS